MSMTQFNKKRKETEATDKKQRIEEITLDRPRKIVKYFDKNDVVISCIYETVIGEWEYRSNLNVEEDVIESHNAEHEDGSFWKYVSLELRSKKHLALLALHKEVVEFEWFPDFANDEDVAIQAIKTNKGGLFDFVGKTLRSSPSFLLKAFQHGGSVWSGIYDKIRKDRDFFLEAVKFNGSLISEVDRSLKNDKELVYHALKNDPCVYRHISKYLKNDIFVSDMAISANPEMIQFAPPYFSENRKYVLSIIHQNFPFEILSETLLSDKSFNLDVIKKTKTASQFYLKLFGNDLDFMLSVVELVGSIALRYTDYSRDFFMKVIKLDPICIRHYRGDIDKEIVLHAVKYGLSLDTSDWDQFYYGYRPFIRKWSNDIDVLQMAARIWRVNTSNLKKSFNINFIFK